MESITLELSDDLACELTQLASSRGITLEALIIEVMERQVNREELLKKANDLLGKFSSGLRDVAANHDEYYADAIESRWRNRDANCSDE